MCCVGAYCCCTLSVFGIIVLVVMGMMIQNGDPYVGGHELVATAEDRAKRAGACFSAAGIYVLCLGLSGVCYWNGGRTAEKAADD